MKTIFPLILLILLSCKNSSQKNSEKKTVFSEKSSELDFNKNQDLFELIELNINSDKAKAYIKDLGNPKTSDLSIKMKDYHYINSGIQFRTDLNGIIKVIFCYNKNERLLNMPVKFKGVMPFELSFEDTLNEIENKHGKGRTVHRYGRYGRVFQWVIQDSLKISMEIELPKTENDKIFVEFISLSKVR